MLVLHAVPKGGCMVSTVTGPRLASALKRQLGARFASTAGAAAAVGPAAGADAAVAAQQAPVDFIGDLLGGSGSTATAVSAEFQPYHSITGTYFPDYSVTVPTGFNGFIDSFLHVMQLPMELMHTYGGLPWWAAIASGTLLFRAVTMPTLLKALRTGGNLLEHQRELTERRKRMAELSAASDTTALLAERRSLEAFNKRYGISPMAMFMPILQMPALIGFFFAVQRFARDAHLLPGMLEPALWMPALVAPDPTMIIPLTASALSILSVLLNPSMNGMPQNDLTPKGQRLLMVTMTGLFTFATVNMPAVSQIYIGVNAVTYVVQQLLLRSKGFRRWFGFSDSWPLPPEKVAARLEERGGPQINPFGWLAPLFRVFSALADGQFLKATTAWAGKVEPQQYVSRMGLRDPGIPPAPRDAPAATIVAAAPRAAAAAASASAVPGAGTAAAPASAAAAARVGSPGFGTPVAGTPAPQRGGLMPKGSSKPKDARRK